MTADQIHVMTDEQLFALVGFILELPTPLDPERRADGLLAVSEICKRNDQRAIDAGIAPSIVYGIKAQVMAMSRKDRQRFLDELDREDNP